MTSAIVIVSLLLGIFVGCDALFNDTLAVSLRPAKKLCEPVRRCIAKLDKGESCDTLPIPKRAQLNLMQTGYRLTKVRDGVWVFEDLAYLSLILNEGSRLAVLDFPEQANDKGLPLVIDAVSEILGGKKPGRIDMVYSHAHYDHIGGATLFYNWAKEKYPSAIFFKWGTFETRRMIKASESKRAPLPNVIIRPRGRTLSLGNGLDVKMEMVGGHTAQDLALHIPPHKGMPGVLMLIDITFPRWAPFFNLAITDNVRRAVEVQKEVLKKEFEIFIGGHLRIGSKRDVRESYKFYKDLIAAAASASELSDEEVGATGIGRIFDPSAPEVGNLWYGVGRLRGLQVAKCKRIMIEKWGCQLGAVDITIESHCFVAVTFVLVEG